MEAIDPVWMFSGIALVIGFVLGALVQMWINPSSGDVDKLQSDLEKARSELESYKASVNRHFNKTSDLVNELTQDYVKVYQHLAEGAEALGNNPEFARALEQSQGRVLITVDDAESVVTADADEAAIRETGESADRDTAESPAPPEPDTGEAGRPTDKTPRGDEASAEAGTDETGTKGRRDPVIGDGEQDAGGDPPMEPRDDAPASAQAAAESDPRRKS